MFTSFTGVPSASKAKSPKHKMELNSKATEDMYKKLFAPRISELFGKEIPEPYRTTLEDKSVQTTAKKSPEAENAAPAQPTAKKQAEAQPAPKYRSSRKSN